jgi:MFS family permease
MVATLPGRTHGLGLFTEPIRQTFGLDTESYGFLNLWATLIGGLFCFPCGWLLDRVGTRLVLAGVTIALGTVVLLMSWVGGAGWVTLGESLILPLDLFLLVMLTRGLGQSALSVASLSLVARSVGKREGLAMGVYAFLTTAGFVATFTALRAVIQADPDEWRLPWAGIGVAVVAVGCLFLVLVRDRVVEERPPVANASGSSGSTPVANASGSSGGTPVANASGSSGGTPVANASGSSGSTLGDALRSPTFWVFALATSFYGMVAAGTSLFNEKLLAERGLDKTVFLNVTIVGIPAGLLANLLGGFLATRISLGYVLAGAMLVMAGALVWFPYLHTETEAYLYATALAAAGGVVTVTFFTVWRKAFGISHLGRIQGAAQFLTVIFSALGPQLFGSAHARLGGFGPIFPYLAAIAGLMAVAAAFTRVPTREAA